MDHQINEAPASFDTDWAADLSADDRATLTAARAILTRRMANRTAISSWDALIAYLTMHLAPRRAETFRVLYLDRKNVLIRDEETGRGCVDHVPVYPREIARRALDLDASALILAHNHPSGDPSPSPSDIKMTKEIAKVCKVLGLTLHDHVIVGSGETYSMRAHGDF